MYKYELDLKVEKDFLSECDTVWGWWWLYAGERGFEEENRLIFIIISFIKLLREWIKIHKNCKSQKFILIVNLPSYGNWRLKCHLNCILSKWKLSFRFSKFFLYI
jgi:hypothetical protein